MSSKANYPKELFTFHVAKALGSEPGQIDTINKVIRGVSLITGDLTAEGHALEVTKETLAEVLASCKEQEKIPMKYDHGSGVEKVGGHLKDFYLDGNRVRGNLHLLKTHAETEKTLERAETMPECFGLSVAFEGPKKGVSLGNGKFRAKCDKMRAADCVTAPAANPTGLFSAKESVDTNGKPIMALETEGTPTEPTIAQVLQAVQALTTKVDAQQATIEQLSQTEESEYDTLQRLNEMTDEELAAEGGSREQLNQLIDAYNSSAEGGGGEGGEGAGGEGGGEAGGEGTVAAPAAGTVGAELSALRTGLIQLQQKIAGKEAAEEAATTVQAFQVLESKIDAVGLANAELTKTIEFLEADNDALRLAVRTGTRPSRAGIDNGMRLFSANENGELHPFQERVKEIQLQKKCTEAVALKAAMREPNGSALHEDWKEWSRQTRMSRR